MTTNTEHATSPPDDALAAKLRGFGPIGILAMVVVVFFAPLFEPFGVLPGLWWAHRSRTPWSELGFVRPRSWIATVSIGVVFGTAFKLAMKAIVMPLLGAPEINQAYHYLADNSAELPGMMAVVIFGAGFGEEFVFRGFLFERLGKLLGSGVPAKAAIIVLTSVYFGGIHYFVQGFSAVEQSTIMGLVFGTIFMIRKRIFILMVAHAAFDVVAVLIIYYNLESYVAHLVFK
jgi:membrane protease YdiL (CAAX protease family)